MENITRNLNEKELVDLFMTSKKDMNEDWITSINRDYTIPLTSFITNKVSSFDLLKRCEVEAHSMLVDMMTAIKEDEENLMDAEFFTNINDYAQILKILVAFHSNSELVARTLLDEMDTNVADMLNEIVENEALCPTCETFEDIIFTTVIPLFTIGYLGLTMDDEVFIPREKCAITSYDEGDFGKYFDKDYLKDIVDEEIYENILPFTEEDEEFFTKIICLGTSPFTIASNEYSAELCILENKTHGFEFQEIFYAIIRDVKTNNILTIIDPFAIIK